ncbi:MAG: sulfurtransferase-like selenium metabolism protein YedF [Veillonella sp.]|uniref:sulfurtransferase-like selenium metabolism protein YedF n=1 Tax=Veillonella sp. TaxID=1926307 RepID=UPI00260083BF|nr:sulfurtransferase-like selenium metabolism protein YedF [Veillonella sp.]MBS4913323.1 sulfurtransferase-like selenium metabolism protein YedF [Veillonella sp.]
MLNKEEAKTTNGHVYEVLGDGTILVDVRGSLCPIPVIETKVALEAEPEATIVTIVDNEVSRDNVVKFGQSRGRETEVLTKGESFYITLTGKPPVTGEAIKVQATATQVTTPAFSADANSASNYGNKVLLVTKDYLGEGSEELGRTLMKTFWYCMTEAPVKPKKIFFINSGVKMVCEGSAHLEHLAALVEAGVEVGACGICLDYYGIKDAVKVGTITNLYAITDAMMTESMVTL